MNIRRMVESDRTCYLGMAEAFYRSPAVLHPVPREHFQRTFDEMQRSDVYVDGFLLEDGQGRCMGYALTAKTFGQEAGGQVVWLEELYVLPAFQGRGVGTKVLGFLEGYYPQCKRFRLEIEPDNRQARRLYERLGYRALDYGQMMKERP